MERVNPFYRSKRQHLESLRPAVLKAVPLSVNTKESCPPMHDWFSSLGKSGYGGELDNPEDLDNTLALLQKLVIESAPHYSDDFSFKKIQGMTASRHNFYNWKELPDALAFGMNLNPEGKAKFSTPGDFEKAKDHVLRNTVGELTINILGWHNSRVIWQQGGASHHGAAMLRYLHEQEKDFFCRAKITRYDLNSSVKREIEELAKNYYLLVMDDPNNRIGYDGLRSNKMGLKVVDISLQSYANAQPSLFIIPKRQKRTPKIALARWVNTLSHEKRAIPFLEFLDDPRLFE